ncbi:MAG: hypothetical protein EXS63_03680 [Candidatus Omnitrophica bacterium]|nr:hypothetical protein [Candidatus Omnitrophota bacterium]
MIRWVTKDWGLKLISLVLAIGLWNYAVGEESVEVTRTVPLKIHVQNPNVSVLKLSSETLQVTLVSQRNLLSDLASVEIIAVHEIGKEMAKAGEYTFQIEAREIKLPKPQIQVTSIQPEIIRMTLDELIVVKLPVKPKFVGEPAFGYKVATSQIQLDPNAILVQGPKGELEKLDAVSTEPIDLVGRIRSFRRTLSIALPSNLKAVSESLIDAHIPINEEFEEKKFLDVAFKVLRSPEKNDVIEIKPLKVSFVVSGSKRQLEKLTPQNILAYVDLASLSEGDHEVPVIVALPEDVTMKDKIPVVHVSVKKK